jgi:Skp family chaperone for outer membrane proteins
MLFPHRPGLLAAGIALSLLVGAPACAGRDEAETPTTAAASGPVYVDLPKVLTEYRKTSAFGKYQQRLRDQAKVFGQEMTTLSQLRFSTDEERKEALALTAKTSPNGREKARLEELMKKGDLIENEIAALSQKPSPTAAETARLQELSRMRTEGVRSLVKAETDRRDQLRQMEAGIMAEVETDLLALVQKVAKDEKLPVIYERRAVLFGGKDLTQTVVKKLPK